jgi:hypothetical protein
MRGFGYKNRNFGGFFPGKEVQKNHFLTEMANTAAYFRISRIIKKTSNNFLYLLIFHKKYAKLKFPE